MERRVCAIDVPQLYAGITVVNVGMAYDPSTCRDSALPVPVNVSRPGTDAMEINDPSE
jgi:hypothetical protein